MYLCVAFTISNRISLGSPCSLRDYFGLVIECNIGQAGASPPCRTASIIFLYTFIYIIIYIYICVVRRALNVLRASFSPIFQYFSAINVTHVLFSPTFQYFVICVLCHVPWNCFRQTWIRQPWIRPPWIRPPWIHQP